MSEKILFIGGSSQCQSLLNMINKKLIKYNNDFFPKSSIPSFIFDERLLKPYFKSKLQFGNLTTHYSKFISHSKYFIVSIGGDAGKARLNFAKKLLSESLIPLSIVSRNCFIDETSKIGLGVQILHKSFINNHCIIGDFTIINSNASVDHEVSIGKGCHIMGNASIAGRVKIGNYVNIGTNATILPDVEIGDGAYVGAGAVVIKNIKKNQIVVGNPAKPLLNK